MRGGKRARVLESRTRWPQVDIDRHTETALRMALQQHGAACSLCAAGKPCPDAEEISEQLELLFPAELRKNPRR
jgi:hypothetical protein